jgi:hypothetical protein
MSDRTTGKRKRGNGPSRRTWAWQRFVLQTLAFVVFVGTMPMLALSHVSFAGVGIAGLSAATLGILRLFWSIDLVTAR